MFGLFIKLSFKLSNLFDICQYIQTDFEDPSSELGDRRFRISYAGGTNTVKNAMERFHHFWIANWVCRVRAKRDT